MAQPAGEGAAQLVGALNKLMKLAVGVGVGASVLQTSLYTGSCLVDGVPGWHSIGALQMLGTA